MPTAITAPCNQCGHSPDECDPSAVRYSYEISRYGLLKTWAGKLGYGEAADLLGATLEEEKRADALLTKLAGVPSKPASSAAAAKLKVA